MDKTDYEEPCCPMDNSMWVKKQVKSVPTDRIIAKEDEYLAKKDYNSAKRHLLYWLEEAKGGNDMRGALLICNELMGLYRKTGEVVKAEEYAQKATALVESLGLSETVSGAMSFLNAGTVYKAVGDAKKSLECFEKCRAVYEKELVGADERKAGLYNNMALTLVDLKRFAEARELYKSALENIKDKNNPDIAVTLLNIADCAVAEKGLEAADGEISSCLEKAEELLEGIAEENRDAYYAFVCEKCAPVFDYYGYFFAAKKFADRAKAIYGINT